VASAPTVAVILAAGKGTRLKSKYAKALFPLCGTPLAWYPIRAARQAGIDRVVLVVGYQAAAVQAVVGEAAEYALQAEQKGTGHAVLAAEETLRGFTGTVFVHCVDAPLLPAETIADLLAAHRAQGNAATVLTTLVPDATGYGRIVRDDGAVARIVEHKDASEAQRQINEINTGIYCFEAPRIFEVLHGVTPNNAQGEYYLTDVVEHLIARGARVGAEIAPDERLVAGINDRVQLAEAEATLRAAIRLRHLRHGVTLIDPASTFIDEDVEIAPDTVVEPFTHLRAGSRIGSDCVVGPSSILEAAILEDDTRVVSSWIEKSIVRTGARVGPYARLRPGCDIGPGAIIGNYAELKNTTVGANSHVHHVGYLGDTTLGEGVNIGAGTITCNFDGVQKHPTAIGDKAFIGSGNLIVAPIEIGENALTGAGSVVTHDVPAGKVAFGVPARVVKDREAKG